METFYRFYNKNVFKYHRPQKVLFLQKKGKINFQYIDVGDSALHAL